MRWVRSFRFGLQAIQVSKPQLSGYRTIIVDDGMADGSMVTFYLRVNNSGKSRITD